ncbi:MAG TPA: sensor domain-containing diguanylate cyclase, partial [Nitrospiria bacterium]|nr:sensor domain-containing diguanylate cyclase [Nitrospiria bacterium]
VILRSIRHLFPIESGALYMLMASRNLVERTVAWGSSPPEERLFPPQDCWALRKGQIHRVDDSDSGLICPHVKQPLSTGYLCIPIQAQNDVLGILHLTLSKSDDPGGSNDGKEHPEKAQQRLAATVAEQIALALSNILLRDVLRNQAIRDPLTGLFNRRFLEEMMVKEVCRAERAGQAIGVVMIDIDRFKRYNDTHGHEAGDVVLSALGRFFNEKIRRGDIACRYGGEEFTLILPGASMEDTLRRAQSVCKEVRQLKPQYRDRLLEGITLSLGVAVFPDHGSNAEDLLRAADLALYRAKAEGRDRVMCARPPI